MTWEIFISKYFPVILIIVFQAGGVVYLTKNHIAHLAKNVVEILTRMRSLESRISYIEGHMDIKYDDTK